MADSWLDVVTDALYEIGSYGPGDSIPDHDTALVQRKLNGMLDGWAALKRFAYNVNFSLYTLTPAHQPHLIGPGLAAPDFAAVQRPVRIEGAALVLDPNGSAIDLPLAIRDDDWWRNKRAKTVTSSVPTNLYPSYDAPSVALYFWPVVTVAYGMRLEMWVSLGQVDDLTTTFVAPQGYKEAVTLTLAEKICRPMGRPLTDDLVRDAARARAVIQSNNIKSPRIGTRDYGGSGRGDWNPWTGGPA
jgi:hypothetical protein